MRRIVKSRHLTNYHLLLILLITIQTAMLTGQVRLSVTSDKEQYVLGEPIQIYITADNPSQDSIRLDFNSSCQSGYYIGDWNSITSPNWGCLLSNSWVIIPPETSYTWTEIHDTSDYYLSEGVYPIVGFLFDQNSYLSAPNYIEIGTNDTVPNSIWFYPAEDTLQILSGCDVNYYTLFIHEDSSTIDYITFETEGEPHIVDWTYSSMNDLIQIWYPNAYFAVIDSINVYTYTILVELPDRTIEIQPGSEFYMFNENYFTLKLLIYYGDVLVDSAIQIINHEYGLGTQLDDIIPEEFLLHNNYPNPFNPVTAIQYEIPIRSYVQIIVYDLAGKEVASLISETQDPGIRSIRWDASNIASGVYFCQIRAGDFVQTKKMAVIK